MKSVWLSLPLLAAITISFDAYGQEFTVHRAADDSVVFTGTLSAEVTDPGTTQLVRLADFSGVTEPGEYYVAVPELGRSVAFRVGADVYDGELANMMLGFYGWRSGIDVAFERHGISYQHNKGHTQDGLLDYVDGQVGVRKDGTGGWYDAGDYGKYLPTAAVSVNSMLYAWELFHERLEKVELPFIPEHGGVLPDYLDEIKWELDWLLKMQYDDGSGRVHHKLNSPKFPGFVLPENDPTTRYFSNFSTAATAEFVAIMAKAARAFKPYDAVTDNYSAKLLAAAQLSYEYLKQNPENSSYDSSILTAGAYQKDNDIADRIWAAAELWETTGEPSVLADFEARIVPSTTFVANFDWDNTLPFGLLTYAVSKREGRNPEIAAQLMQRLDEIAQSIVDMHGRSAYGRGYSGYYWGSNGVIARTCLLLQGANSLKPNPKYLDVCADQVAYLYGRNQYNRSQVTGSGIQPPVLPHHRPSGADAAEQPYPGLVVGGGQSPVDWKDVQNSYATNEVAINWNSALVFALAGFVDGSGAASLGVPATEPQSCSVRVSSVGYLPDRAKVASVVSECDLPSTFKCEMGEQTMSGDTTGAPAMIDDMEDGDTSILTRGSRQGTWSAYDDNTGGTRTQPEVKPADRKGSKSAMCISGGGFTGWGGGIALGLAEQAGARTLYDASAYTGVTFWAKGSSNQFRFMVVDKYSDPAASLCSGCYDHFQAPFTPTAEWKQYTFSWKDLKQQNFGDAQPSVCATEVFALQVQWPGNTEFELCLDDIAFTTPAGTAGETPSGEDVDPSGGGCGCRVADSGAGSQPWAFGALTVLGLCAARRISRRRSV